MFKTKLGDKGAATTLGTGLYNAPNNIKTFFASKRGKKESLKQVLIDNPLFALEITSKNYKNESHLFEIIKNISYKQMRGKLASSLLYLSQDDFLKEDVFLSLTRQDIADFASISTESAIKFLKELEKEKVLKLVGKNIDILNIKKLESISKNG